LICVFCYLLVVAHVGFRKGGISSHKSTNGILAFQKHLETSHPKIWTKWIEQEKVVGLGNKRSTKKRSSSTPSNIASFFGGIIPCSKNDPHQIQFEEDLVLFIAKELVLLFFVEASFFKRLILR
jgi:hypothetical protein